MNDTMTLFENSEAHAIGFVLNPKTRTIVGWLYEWEDGLEGILWTGKPLVNYIVEKFVTD